MRAALHRDAIWKEAKSYFLVAATIVRKPKHGLKIMSLIWTVEDTLTIKHECELYKKDQLQQMYTTKESKDFSDLYLVHENQTSTLPTLETCHIKLLP